MTTSLQIEELTKLRNSLKDAKSKACVTQKIWRLRNPEKIEAINASRRDGIDRTSAEYKAERLKIKKANAAARNKRWYLKDLEKSRQKSRDAQAKWVLLNPDSARKCWEKFRSNMTAQEKSEYHKRQYELRTRKANYRIESRLRVRCRNAILAAGAKKKSKTLELIGCTWQQAREWIELKFTRGMTWENMGLWHIDHIKPCTSFNLSESRQQQDCFHYTNLQPLWARENLTKGSKVA